MGKRYLEFIKVKRNNQSYKIYLKDIKAVVRVPRKSLPPVPSFEEASPCEGSKGVDLLSIDTRDSKKEQGLGTGSFDFDSSIEFEPFAI